MKETEPCRCKTGRETIEIHEEDKPVAFMEITCVICNGTGRAPVGYAKAEAEFWCQCGNPSGDVTFYDDGEGYACGKHHYVCNDCGAVVQVG